MDFVEIQILVEESGERRDQPRHGKGQEVHGSLRVPRPRPRLPRPHGGAFRHDLAGETKVPIRRNARCRKHSVASILSHDDRRRNDEGLGMRNSVEWREC